MAFRSRNAYLCAMSNLSQSVVYVLHVRKGYEERERFMQAQLHERGIAFEWVLEHDLADLKAEEVDRQFCGELQGIQPAVSCALKHMQAWKNLLASDKKGALVLEDDMILDPAFASWLEQFIQEAETREGINHENYFLSLENSLLSFVPKSEQKEGQHLYPRSQSRCAGAYYLTRAAAGVFLQRSREEKLDLPVDWWIGKSFAPDRVQLYWTHPTIAEQGSHNGMFSSGIDHKPKSRFRRFSFAYQKWYKSLLAKFR